MKNINFEKSDKITIVRSAHIGDFLVCIPFIEHLINQIGVLPKNLQYIVINDSKANPVNLCFGDSFFPLENIHILDNNPRTIFQNILCLKKTLDMEVTHVLYLPFVNETVVSLLKKYSILKLLFGPFKKIHGFGKHFLATSPSQYLSLFERYGLHYSSNRDYLRFLKLNSGPEQDKVSQLYPIIPGRCFAIYPHSKLPMKVWPKARYIELIKHIIEQYDPTIYLIGSSGDYDYNQSILEKYSIERNKIFNVAGSLTIRESICLLSRMELVVGNDGAPLHMAALANVPIVGLFTFKAPVGMWDPVITNRMATLRKNIECRGCNKGVCLTPYCLTEITIDNVLKEIELITDKSAGYLSATIVI